MLLNDQGRKTYDANGNSLNDTFRAYTWDADGNSHTIGSATLTYDALDRMVEQTTGSANSEIVYGPGGGKLALMNGSTLLKAFVPLTGGATAVYTSSGLAYYRHTDHLGTSRLSSTPTNTVYSDTAYSAFGEPYAQVGADPSFTGQNQDTTAGLYDFLFREQDPNQGRWASPDPAGLAAVDPTNPQSWNRYSYVLNSPLNFVDPLGLTCYHKVNSGGGDVQWVQTGSNKSACLESGDTWIDDGITIISLPCFFDASQRCPGPPGGPAPIVGSGSPASMGPGDPNARKKNCSHQADLAALEDLLPGINRGQYVSTAAKIGAETGAHLGLEAAAASSVLKRGIRARTGIPMSVTSKWLGRATTALLVFSGYLALKAAQDEYQACMNY